MADTNGTNSTNRSLICSENIFNGLTVANSIAIIGFAVYAYGKMNRLEDEIQNLRDDIGILEINQKTLKSKVADTVLVKVQLSEAESRIETLEHFMESLGDADEAGNFASNFDNIFTALEAADIECDRGTKSKKKSTKLSKKNSRKVRSKSVSDNDDEDIYADLDAQKTKKAKLKIVKHR